MRKRIIILILVSVGPIGGSVFVFCYLGPESKSNEGIVRPHPTPMLIGSPATQGYSLSAPPKVFGQVTKEATPEREGILIGTSTGELNVIEDYLPPTSKISTYPVSETEKRAAVARTDLTGDGRTETVVVYETSSTDNKDGGRSLSLAVLLPADNKLKVVSSAPLVGGVDLR